MDSGKYQREKYLTSVGANIKVTSDSSESIQERKKLSKIFEILREITYQPILCPVKWSFKIKVCNKTQRRGLYNDKEINARRGYYTCYIKVPDTGALKYILTGIVEEFTIKKQIVWDFNSILTSMDRLSRKKINKQQ